MKAPKPANRPTIALFDFDGTLTIKDSFRAFLEYTHGWAGISKQLLYLWPVLLLYKLKIISNGKAKKLVFRRFYKNWPLTFFREKATVFCTTILPEIINPEAHRKLKWHQQQGHRVIIVSAMFDLILEEWCKANKVELLATGLEINKNQLTGNFRTTNCYGPEKVKRLKETDLLKGDPIIFAYGDSGGDTEMLKLAHQPFYRKF